MFLGEYQHSVDDKGRLVMPSKVRHHLADGLFITKGQERCLYVFTPDRWSREMELVDQIPRTRFEARMYARSFFGGGDEQQMDKQGRIRIPPPLLAYAGIAKDARIIGVSDRLEIWDAETWERESAEYDEKYSNLQKALGGEGI